MKIIHENYPKIKISELEYGEAFILDGELYMRIRSNDANAVSLATGDVYDFTHTVDVVRVDVQVVFK